MPGTLILAATSLGEPLDIPVRSLEWLRKSELVVFEEDRPARSFLKAAAIHRDYLKFSEHDEKNTLDEVVRVLSAGGTVTYMSDQGTPNFADPGRQLTKAALACGASVTVIPGPSSLMAALSACPFNTEPFVYWGFLPQEKQARDGALQKVKEEPRCVVLLDTPYRLGKLLNECANQFPSRRALIAVDISGPAETFRFDTLKNLEKEFAAKGKYLFVLVLEATSSRSRG